MLVVCGRCETEYEFDDALLSERGTTVKCTNCGYQFRVRPPRGLQPRGERWEVRLQDGGTMVFQSLRDLRRAIDEDQVGIDDQLSRDGGPLRRLGDVAELEALFRRKNTRLAPQGHTLMGVGVPDGVPKAPGVKPPPRRAPAVPPPAPRTSAKLPGGTQRVHTIPRPGATTPGGLDAGKLDAARVGKGFGAGLDRTQRSAVADLPAGPPVPTMPPTTTRVAARRADTPLGSPRAGTARTPTATNASTTEGSYESFSSEDRKSASFSTFRPPPPDGPPQPQPRNEALAATWTSAQPTAAATEPATPPPPAPATIKTPTVPGPDSQPVESADATRQSERPTPSAALPASAVQFASVPPPAEPQHMPPSNAPQAASVPVPSARPPSPLSVPPPPRRTGSLRWVIGFVLVGGLALLAGTVGKDYVAQFIHRGEAESDPRVDEILNTGWEAFRDGDIAGATVQFDQAKALADKDPRVQLAVVQLPVVQADFEWLRLKVLPENAAEHRANAKQAMDGYVVKMNEALAAFSPGAAMATRKALVETDVLRIRNEFDKARELVESSSFDGTDPHAAYVLAMLDLGQSTPAWATVVERLKTALVSERGLGRARSALVYALAVSGDLEAAKAELSKLVEADADHPLSADLTEFVNTLAAGEEAADEEESDDSIVEGAEKPAGSQGSQSPVWLWLDQAGAARRSGDLAGAVGFYKKVLGANPGNANALAGLGAIARLQGNYPEAKNYFDQVLSRSPNHLAALVGGADVRWLMGAKEGAVLLYRKVPAGTAFYSHAQRRIAEFGGAPAAPAPGGDEGGDEEKAAGDSPSEPKAADPKPADEGSEEAKSTPEPAKPKDEPPKKDEAPAKPEAAKPEAPKPASPPDEGE